MHSQAYFHTMQRRTNPNQLAMLRRSQSMITQAHSLMSSSTHAALNPEMSLDDVQRLHRLQSEFERDPLNM